MGVLERSSIEVDIAMVSQTTRCPGCGAVFRVQPMQLEARRGEVRCGICHRIFNAIENLSPDPAGTARYESAPAGTKNLVADAAAWQAQWGARWPAWVPNERTAGSPKFPAPAEEAKTQLRLRAENERTASDSSDQSVRAPADGSVPLDSQFAASENTGHAGPASALDSIASHGEFAASAESDGLRPTSARGSVLFDSGFAGPGIIDRMRSRMTRGVAFGNEFTGYRIADHADIRKAGERVAPGATTDRPWLRPVIAAGVAAAVFLLALLVFRIPLARDHPGLQPFLEGACFVFRCQVALPQDADQLSIEASDLRTDPARPDSIIVFATMRNRARFAQAYPVLELTLTDAQNQTVARRVLQPRDYLDKTQNLKKGLAPNSEVTVRFNIAANGNAASGYRLILFYP